MKIFSLLFGLLLSTTVFGQIGINAGTNMLKGFGPTKPSVGLHIGFEVPRDDAFSIYGRYSHYFNQYSDNKITPEDYLIYVEPNDPMSGIFGEFIGARPGMNYNVLEGGSRYYVGSGFDDGFGAYGGTNIMLVFSKVKLDYDPFDEVNLSISDPRMEGSIFSLGFGLGGGVKYTMGDIGTFYFDVNGSYMILAQASSDYIYGDLYSGLLFTFNLGFRKDLMWE